MGWLDDLGDAASAVGGAITDTVEDAYETAADYAEEAYDTAVGIAEDAYNQVEEYAQDAFDTVSGYAQDAANWFEQGVKDAGDWALGKADQLIFNPLEEVTGGAVKLDYANGDLSANVDLGFAQAGISYGESGFSANATADIGIASASASYDDGDFNLQGQAGVDIDGLPFVSGEVSYEDGNLNVEGQAQGTIPTPFGIVSGEAQGGFHQNADGSWGAYGGADGTLITPSGVTVSAGGSVSYEVSADGDETFLAGGHVGVGVVGGPSVSAGGEYHYIEQDGTVLEGGSGYVKGEGYGVSVGAEGSYNQYTDAEGNVTEIYEGSIEGSGYGHEVGAGGTYVEHTGADGTSSSSADGWIDVDGLDTDDLQAAATSFLKDQAGDLLGGAGGSLPDTSDLTTTMENLAGSGDMSEMLGGFADQAGQSVADIGDKMIESGGFDDFSSDVIKSEVAEAATEDAWDDLTG